MWISMQQLPLLLMPLPMLHCRCEQWVQGYGTVHIFTIIHWHGLCTRNGLMGWRDPTFRDTCSVISFIQCSSDADEC